MRPRKMPRRPREGQGTFRGTLTRSYTSFPQFLAEVHKPNPLPANLRSSEELGSHWAGSYSLPDALGLAERGWPEGCEVVQLIAADILDSVTANVMRPEIVLDVTGECFDMGRVMEDVPECWMDWRETEELATGERPIVRIVVNFSA